ncbi:MAG TPA: IS110 family transposase, partial [Gemmatimonadales bacterium]|nr:IS110 family transposase [Gemmatimonadales bacterium]
TASPQLQREAAMTFVGFDLHKRHITACALDASGVVVAEIRQLTTTLATVLATVLEWLAALPAPITIAMEATLYWAWLAARLEQAGHRAHVADAHQVRLIWHARAKPDTVDSRTLAELLRTNILPTIWVPDLETRRRRQLLWGRAFLVRERTRIKNRIHGHLTAENQRFARCDLYGKAGRAWLEAVALSPVVAAETQRRLHLHDVLTKEIARLDDQVKRAARCDPAAQRLATIPGVGVFGALFLHAEIGPIERFRSSHQLAADAGLVPTTRSSGRKTTGRSQR